MVSIDIIKEISSFLLKKLGDTLFNNVFLEDVRIGLIYTGVKLSSGHGGVAYTFIEETAPFLHEMCLSIKEDISGISLREAVKFASSWNLVEASIGVATLNAASNIVFEKEVDKYHFSNVDVTDLVGKDDKVVMVGLFKPIIASILKKTSKLVVIERYPVKMESVEVLPDFAAEYTVPEADVVIVTGSTLVNKTLDRLLELGKNAKEFILLGPTASVIPDPLFKRGVTAIMGAHITNVDLMLKVVSEAGGTRRLLSSCAKKFALLRDQH